ncbi:fatty acyl-AMP ligase [Trinickia symbiotica]|uniref:Fatty acyl-AMP ligase n=1 Tax=Trinickia symbiotica TaxID=863227 RepID=A0A2T3XU86_9BURK|nr:AMP-binding protein [Trinickia symbiotica]PTB20093.1 fatty acyl-AMP ligase [Trinickia symbiotica]
MSQNRIESEPPRGRTGDAQTRLLALIRELAEETRGDNPLYNEVTLHAHLEHDLGFDSLARAELLARIEHAFGVQLSVDTFASATTAAELLLAVTGEPLREAAASAEPLSPVSGVSPDKAAGRLAIPHHARTLMEAMHWHADRHPERTHIVLIETDGVTESRIGYGELRERAAQMAGGLRTVGIDPGDTVALMLPTNLDYFVAFTAILLCGAIAVPIYPPLRKGRLAEHVERHTALLNNAQIKALVTFEQAETVARLLRTHVPTLRHVLTPERIVRLPMDTPVVTRAEDIALLQYTSGSTGMPKGVVLTHANLLASIRAMGERAAVNADDVLVSWLPLYHDMGLIGAWLAPLYFGVPLVVTSPLTFLAHPDAWLQMISRYRGTITAAPNFAYDRCARHVLDAILQDLDLSSLRLSFCGAEPVSANVMRAFSERMSVARFDARALAPVYGLAENTLAVTFPPPARGLWTDKVLRSQFVDDGRAAPSLNGADTLEIVCCGPVLPGCEMRIADKHGRELPERQIGRIEFRGRAATQGYYRNAEATAQLMDGEWLDSGDLGYVANGELYVTGRVKDMIIHGGRHFFPYELEDAIGRLPGAIAGRVAVCGGIDAARGTERIVIFAETAEMDPDARACLVAQINETTTKCFGTAAGNVMLLDRGSILKTPAGKIRRSAMLERFERSESEGREFRKMSAPHAPWRQVSEVVFGSMKPFVRRSLDRVRLIAYGSWCWALVAAIAPVLWCRVALGAAAARNWHVTGRATRLFLYLAGLRTEVIGETESFPASAAAIVAVNHTSYLDSVVLHALLPHPLHFVAKRELARQPFIGGFLRRLGVRFVERADYRASVEDEERIVAEARDETLLFFPEGTFRRAAGLGPFHLGAFRAACLLGRPVVPIALRGVRAVLRDGDWLPRRGHIVMTVLAPIKPEGTDLRAMVKLRDQVRAAILTHCGEPELIGPAMGIAPSGMEAARRPGSHKRA